jgi:hypothetical protein
LEYLLGSIITLISIVVINRMARKTAIKSNLNFEITQSYLFRLLSEYNNQKISGETPDTQSFKHLKDQYTRIMIVENEAYWIKDNQLYVADFDNGNINSDSTREVDTMAMSAVELEKTMFIVEKLSEDN